MRSTDRQKRTIVDDRRRSNFAQQPFAKFIDAALRVASRSLQPGKSAVDGFAPALDEPIGVQEQYVGGSEDKAMRVHP